jgi:NAD(P)-dependent dehydrogenase (short-subunit alcohol dehydrogenase family)
VFALRLAADGAVVVVNDVDAEPAQETAELVVQSGGQASVLVADTVEMAAAHELVAAAVQRHGKLDIVVNNAGITRDRIFHNLDDELFDRVFDVNFKTGFHTTLAAMPYLREAAKAEIAATGEPAYHRKITFTSSVVAFNGNPGQYNYTAAKGAIASTTKTLARTDVKIPTDSHVMLAAVGFMGERQVTIVRGAAAKSVAPGDTLNGELLMGISDVMAKTGDIIDEVESTLSDLREVTRTLNADNKLRDGIDDFAATGKNLRSMTEENRVQLNRTMDNLDKSTAQLTRLLDAHYADIDSSLTAFGKAGREVQHTVDHLTEISDNLSTISTNLKNGKGSAGRLLTDKTLVLRLESATASLDTLLKDMREHPNRYVKFSLF